MLVMKNIKILLIMIYSILLSQIVVFQVFSANDNPLVPVVTIPTQYYYSPGAIIPVGVNGSTATYACYDEFPGTDAVVLHNKSNTLTVVKQRKTDGSPMQVEGIKNYYTIPPAKYSTIHNTIASFLTAEDKQRIKNNKNSSVLVSLYINSNTGAVTEVNFFFLTNEVFGTIPPETYYKIETALKKDFSVNMLAEGKKLNYNIYTYTFSYVPGWVPGW